jgi:hypothetical protein
MRNSLVCSNDIIKRTITTFGLVFLFMQGCVTLPGSDSLQGKVYYTTANIWYTNPVEIKNTNYHMGAIIPFGTKGVIEKINRKKIMFRAENGASFTIIRMKRHSNISMQEHFHRYFSKTDPMAQGGLYHRFSEMEKQNIRKGNVVIGMAKEAVLSSYGYPPSHATPDLKADHWRYWIIGRQEVRVIFIDNRVSSIQKLSVSGPPPGLKHITNVSSLLETE